MNVVHHQCMEIDGEIIPYRKTKLLFKCECGLIQEDEIEGHWELEELTQESNNNTLITDRMIKRMGRDQ